MIPAYAVPVSAVNYYDPVYTDNPFFNYSNNQNCLVTIKIKCNQNNTSPENVFLQVKSANGSLVNFNKTNGIYSSTAIGGSSYIEVTDEKVVLSVPPGDYKLIPSETTSFRPENDEISFSASNNTQSEDIEINYLSESNIVYISAHDELGNPVQELKATITDAFGEKSKFFQSDSEYIYMTSSGLEEISIPPSGAQLSGLPSGKYKLEITTSPDALSVPESLVFSISEDALNNNVDIVCSSIQGSMTIINVDPLGNAISGSACTIETSNGELLKFLSIGGNEYKYDSAGTITSLEFDSTVPVIVTGLSPDVEYIVKEYSETNTTNLAEPQKVILQNGVPGYVSLQTKATSGSLAIKVSDKATNAPLQDFVYQICSIKEDGSSSIMYFSALIDSPTSNTFIYNENGDITAVSTDEDGEVLVNNLPVGEYSISCKESPVGYVTNSEPIIKTISHNSVTKCDISAPKSNVAIEVLDENESPIANVLIEIYNSAGELILDSKTNAKGKILLTNIANGNYSYRLKEAPEGYSYINSAFNFTINDAGTADGSTVIILKKVKIRIGVPAQGDSASMENAVFALYDSSGAEVSRALTDSTGIAVFSGVCFGDYTIKQISAPIGFQVSKSELKITVDSKYSNEDVYYLDKEITPPSVTEDSTDQEQEESTPVNIGDVFFIIIGILIVLFVIVCVIQLITKLKSNTSVDCDNEPHPELQETDVKIFTPARKSSESLLLDGIDINSLSPEALKELNNAVQERISNQISKENE